LGELVITQDHLLIFCVPNKDEWEAGCAQMISAGFRNVSSYNPYWDLQGQDVRRYRWLSSGLTECGVE